MNNKNNHIGVNHQVVDQLDEVIRLGRQGRRNAIGDFLGEVEVQLNRGNRNNVWRDIIPMNVNDRRLVVQWEVKEEGEVL